MTSPQQPAGNGTTEATASQHGAVLQPSQPVSESSVPVKGPDFDEVHSLHKLLGSYGKIGFQATSFGKACEIVDEMVRDESLLFVKSSLTEPQRIHSVPGGQSRRLPPRRPRPSRPPSPPSRTTTSQTPTPPHKIGRPSSSATPRTSSRRASGRLSATSPSTR